MATLGDVENCYRYILGRAMNSDETQGAEAAAEALASTDVDSLRQSFLRSPEFHVRHLETFFENLVPKSVIVAYDTAFGFRIYLDLRQLHLTFGILSGAYERHEIDILRAVVPADGVFIDVGANVGYFSLAIASRPGFAGKVHAFEPVPPVHTLFERSVRENGLEERVIALRMALSNAPGSMALTNAESSINIGSTRLDLNGTSGNALHTATVGTLDSVACDLTPDVIKIDIEGAEALCLEGSIMTINRHRPTLLVEINPELLKMMSGTDARELQARLSDFGYDLWAVHPDRLETVGSRADLGKAIPPSGVLNIFCVHKDRRADVEAILPTLRRPAAA
jgi:FkbM family methyltransferase